ncbi:MAG: hypothetical protein ACKVQS_10850 [Fimbriimonadaceae bacterium]
MRNKRNSRNGHTLIEAMFASFLALLCALIFSATIPVANVTRGKADNMNAATTLAQKMIESARSKGYPNVTNQRLVDTGLADNTTLVNLNTLGVGSAGELAVEFTGIDSAIIDSPGTVLPSGRGFIYSTQTGLDMRQITVVVMWRESSGTRNVRLTSLVANL